MAPPSSLLAVSNIDPLASLSQANSTLSHLQDLTGTKRLRALPAALWVLARGLTSTLAGACYLAALSVLAGGGRLCVRLAGWLATLITRGLAPLMDGVSRGQSALEIRYRRVLTKALASPLPWLSAALLLLSASLWTIENTGRQLLPDIAQGMLLARADLKVGTSLDDSAVLASELEPALLALDDVASLYTVVGEDEGADAPADKGPHSVEFWINLHPARKPSRQQARVKEAVRMLLEAQPGVTVRVETPSLLDLPPPIEVALLTHDLALAASASEALETQLKAAPALRDVQRDLRPGYPEVRIHYRREAFATYGLELTEVANTVRDLLHGVVATRVERPEQMLDLRVAMAQAQHLPASALAALNVNPKGNPPIRLDAVAQLERAVGPSEIRHLEGRRGARLTAAMTGTDLSTAIAQTWEAIGKAALPRELDVELRGQVIDMKESVRSLWFALALALFLVYAIMASQFEDLLAPLAILFAVPLAIVGVAITQALVGLELSVLVLIGFVVLVGIVVNNAIVLITTVGQLRAQGMDGTQALIEAGVLRLRPILITTITTVLGLLPMALGGGQGVEIRAPLAWTVMGGLISSTALTLIIVPIVYRLLHRLPGTVGVPAR